MPLTSSRKKKYLPKWPSNAIYANKFTLTSSRKKVSFKWTWRQKDLGAKKVPQKMVVVKQAYFFNHFAAMEVNAFFETLSLAENSLSLERKPLSLAKMKYPWIVMKIWYLFNVSWENVALLRSFGNIFSLFLLKIFRKHGFRKKIVKFNKNPWV